MQKIYKKYMRKCINLAKLSLGKVAPNPLVGAVVLDKNGNFAGCGRHEKYGHAHAEVNAIKNAKENGFDIKGGTIIVNLEPCSHFGKTPPCADLIIKEGLRTVVVGCKDPNPKVAGRGIKKLEDAKIKVVVGVLEDECKKLNEVFIKNHTKNAPFVVLKTATTLDGKIATKTGSSKWITAEKSRNYVQKLRNEYDAILTGSGTVIVDNPSLTCRLKNGKNPIRIVIDSQLKTDPKSKVYNGDGTKIFVAVAENTDIKGFGTNTVEFIKCSVSKTTGKIDLSELLIKLYEKGINSIMVEAGGELNQAFIQANLADKLYQFVAPKILGDSEAKSFVSGCDIKDINDSHKLLISSTKKLGQDIVIECYFG